VTQRSLPAWPVYTNVRSMEFYEFLRNDMCAGLCAECAHKTSNQCPKIKRLGDGDGKMEM
jgi:hypothetical protein